MTKADKAPEHPPLSNKWAYIEHKSMKEVGHVFPLNDLNDHVLTIQCWCCPEEDENAPGVWVHNSADGREKYETGESKPS